MPRFFVSRESIGDGALFISGDDARHIARALRMAVGDTLTVSDNEGNEYTVKLTKIRDERCDCEILESAVSRSEPPSKITLYMAYPKGDKLETVIQKAVELGASRIVPFESSRCIKRPKADKAKERGARLSRIAEEAAKQCGRAILPEVALPIAFSDMLNEASKASLSLFCYEGEGTSSLKAILDECAEAPESIAVIVGSEGGFSPEEARLAEEKGFIVTGLGPRILRTETAPLCVLSIISAFLEL